MPWQCGMMLRFQFNNRVALSSCNRRFYQPRQAGEITDGHGADFKEEWITTA